jgi:hypothetical protein
MIDVSETVLDGMAEGLQPLPVGKFIHVEYKERGEPKEAWVYPEPMRNPTASGSYIDKDKNIVNLSFPEQLLLQERIKDELDLDLRHGSLKENFQLTFSKEGKEYRERVLVEPYWVYTGEIAKVMTGEENKFDVRRVSGIKTRKIAIIPQQTLINKEGKDILEKIPSKNIENILQIQYIVGQRLQTELPKNGYYDDFGILPTKKDFVGMYGGKAYWIEAFFDEDKFSAVWCGVPTNANCYFHMGSYEPSHKDSNGVIPIWTDENPS